MRITILSLLISSAILGCSSDTHGLDSLLLTIEKQSDHWQVTSYSLLNRTYKKDYQQGRYQVHLVDNNGTVLQKISFDNIAFNQDAKSASKQLQLLVPFHKQLSQIAVFKLDGRSGHYQLKDKDPELKWCLPDELLQKK